MSTRRSFIRQAGISAGAMLIAPNSFGRFFQTRKAKVIVLGAGFAGLAAALKLKSKNTDFTVLESTNRVGGRVFSHQMPNGQTIELGAEWVGNSHTSVIALCEQFKIPLLNNQFDTHLIYKGQYKIPKQWSYTEQWQAKMKQLIEEYEQFTDSDKAALDQLDWWRYLAKNGCSGTDLDIRELLDSTDFGESIRHISAFAALAEYAESSEKNEMDLKMKGGNAVLANSLWQAVGKDNVLLGREVVRIEQAEKVKVICRNGEVFEADKLICTLPTWAVNKIDWQPGMPPEKLQALSELQYARINKHVMQFSSRFWEDESFDMITDQLPHYFYHATKNQPGNGGVLISYTIGDKAAVIANQSDVYNANAIFQTLNTVFGNVQSLLQHQVNYYWGNDERTKGAYAMYGVNQWFRLRPILKQPFLQTHFAGEHIADWQGFMEGAINTGDEAANEV